MVLLKHGPYSMVQQVKSRLLSLYLSVFHKTAPQNGSAEPNLFF